MTDDPKPAARPQVEIYTDGACEPNPGLGGYGAVLLHPKKRAETSGGFRFEYYLYCPKCQAIYMVEEAKRFIEQPPSLF